MKQLERVTARDLMQRKVITLRDADSIEDAIATFEEEHISGAPVLDAAGRPVGVLSAYDVAQTQHMQRARIADEQGEYDYGYYNESEDDPDERVLSAKDDYSPQMLGKETVSDWMSPKVISVAPDDSIQHVCAVMTREGIHRVLVMDGGKLAGIISTFDVVRHVSGLT